MKKAKKAPPPPVQVPLPYDPSMAVAADGSCPCCRMHPSIPHQKGCPIKLVKSLNYRVTHRGDRYTPESFRDESSAQKALTDLLGVLDEDGHLDGILDQYEGEDAEDLGSDFRVELVGDSEIQVGKLLPDSILERKRQREVELRQQRVQQYAPERARRLKELEDNKSLYSAEGYKIMREKILDDPNYQELDRGQIDAS